MSTVQVHRVVAVGLAAWIAVATLLSAGRAAGAAGPVAGHPEPLWDVSGHWAARQVRSAAGDFWAQGFPDQSFRPDAQITRAEFVALLVKANRAGATPGGEQPFADANGHWVTREGFLPVAVRKGVVVPADYGGNRFDPDRPITRLEVAVLAIRALSAFQLGDSRPDVSGGEPLSFSDAPELPGWAVPFVAAAVRHRILSGFPDGSFRPAQTATRAEAVVIVLRQLEAVRREYLATLPYPPGADPDGQRVRVFWSHGFPYRPAVLRPLYGERAEDQPVIGQLLRLIQAAPEEKDPNIRPTPPHISKPIYQRIEFHDGRRMMIHPAIRCTTHAGGQSCASEAGWLSVDGRTLRSDALWHFYHQVLPRFTPYVPLIAAEATVVAPDETLTLYGEGWLSRRLGLFVRTPEASRWPPRFRLAEIELRQGAFAWSGPLPAEVPDVSGGPPLRLTPGTYIIEAVPDADAEDNRLVERGIRVQVR